MDPYWRRRLRREGISPMQTWSCTSTLPIVWYVPYPTVQQHLHDASCLKGEFTGQPEESQGSPDRPSSGQYSPPPHTCRRLFAQSATMTDSQISIPLLSKCRQPRVWRAGRLSPTTGLAARLKQVERLKSPFN